jgi:hypothetical protein
MPAISCLTRSYKKGTHFRQRNQQILARGASPAQSIAQAATAAQFYRVNRHLLRGQRSIRKRCPEPTSQRPHPAFRFHEESSFVIARVQQCLDTVNIVSLFWTGRRCHRSTNWCTTCSCTCSSCLAECVHAELIKHLQSRLFQRDHDDQAVLSVSRNALRSCPLPNPRVHRAVAAC